MKRQRGNARKGVTAKTITKKKAKAVATKAKEVAEKVFVEQKVAAEGILITTEETAAEWDSLWSGVVDEEMSWAAPTTWIPFWEMEATGDAYDALYGDVLWDYDIWDLQSAVSVTNP